MQKAYNIISVVVLIGLGIWIFMLYKANAKLTALIPPPAPPAPPTTPEKSVSGAELWDAVQSKVKDLKIDLTFNQ